MPDEVQPAQPPVQPNGTGHGESPIIAYRVVCWLGSLSVIGMITGAVLIWHGDNAEAFVSIASSGIGAMAALLSRTSK